MSRHSSSPVIRLLESPAGVRPIPIRVRLGIELADHVVEQLTPEGFAIVGAHSVAPGTRVHAAFRTAFGLSVAMDAAACLVLDGSELQRFEFIGATPELLNLLLHSPDTGSIH